MQAAGEGALIGVHPHVGPEISPVGGHLEANVALKLVGLKSVRKMGRVKLGLIKMTSSRAN